MKDRFKIIFGAMGLPSKACVVLSSSLVLAICRVLGFENGGMDVITGL